MEREGEERKTGREGEGGMNWREGGERKIRREVEQSCHISLIVRETP